jgi:small subunit ribosomal protein S6
VHPSAPEEEVDQITQIICELIKTEGGEILKLEKWGKRKLAYEVKKERYGFYIYIYFTSLPPVSKKIERRLNIHEKVIRRMIVNVPEKSPEELKTAPAPVVVAAPVIEPEKQEPAE